jgi:hypothetical protein
MSSLQCRQNAPRAAHPAGCSARTHPHLQCHFGSRGVARCIAQLTGMSLIYRLYDEDDEHQPQPAREDNPANDPYSPYFCFG